LQDALPNISIVRRDLLGRHPRFDRQSEHSAG
jgi:hypothetical protein